MTAAFLVAPACGDLQQASGTTSSDDAGTGASGSGPMPSDGDGGGSPGPIPGEEGSGGPTSDDGSGTRGPVPDDSSSSGPPPECDDGGTDGGGTCGDTGGCADSSDCMAGMVCSAASACAFPASCLELHTAWPETASGEWPLDPDGDGQSTPFECDMTPGDAGWTRVLLEDFDVSDGTAWSNPTITTCGALGQMLGGYGVISGGTLSRGVDALQVPHTEARLGAQYFKIDTWDDETAFAEIDGTQVWSDVFHHSEGPTQECGSGSYNEEEHDAAGQTGQSGDAMTITFGSNLDQGPTNEAWGIDDVEVWVR